MENGMNKFNSANWNKLPGIAVRVFALTIVMVSLVAIGSIFYFQADEASGIDLADASQMVLNWDQDDHSNPNSVSGFNCDHMSACSSVALIDKRSNILIVTTAVVLPEFVNTIVGRSIEPPYFPPKI
jgi:hypothetical protein